MFYQISFYSCRTAVVNLSRRRRMIYTNPLLVGKTLDPKPISISAWHRHFHTTDKTVTMRLITTITIYNWTILWTIPNDLRWYYVAYRYPFGVKSGQSVVTWNRDDEQIACKNNDSTLSERWVKRDLSQYAHWKRTAWKKWTRYKGHSTLPHYNTFHPPMWMNFNPKHEGRKSIELRSLASVDIRG